MNLPEEPFDPRERPWTGDLRLNDTAEEAIRFLRARILEGHPWYPALLEAIGIWTLPEEVVDGRYYRYLIGGEAFDWLLLAERLTEAVRDLIPEAEHRDLVFFNRPPEALDEARFRALVGPAKYRAHLNYLYGVVLEEALFLAVELEVQKEQRGQPWRDGTRTTDAIFERIYGEPLADLLARFWADHRTPAAAEAGGEPAMTWAERKEFLYWLFKFRLNRCDRARVASDTRKALNELNRQWSARRWPATEETPEPADFLDLRPVASFSLDGEGPPSGFASSSN